MKSRIEIESKPMRSMRVSSVIAATSTFTCSWRVRRSLSPRTISSRFMRRSGAPGPRFPDVSRNCTGRWQLSTRPGPFPPADARAPGQADAGLGNLGMRRKSRSGHAFWADLLAVLHPDEPVDDHALAGLQAPVDEPLGPVTRADLHRADLDPVVESDHAHLVEILKLLDGGLGDEERPAARLQRRADLRELPRPQDVSGIGEKPADAQGPGGGVDAAPHDVELPRMRIGGAIGQDELQADLPASGRRRLPDGGDPQELLLTDGKLDVQGIDLRHGGEERILVAAHHVADIGRPDAGHAVDRRDYPGEADV